MTGKTNPMPLATVIAISAETSEIKSFVLVPEERGLLAGIEPGAHIDIRAGGHVRQYSLCNGPGDRQAFLIAVKREESSRGGSRALHDSLAVGDLVEIAAPRNSFRPAPDATRSLLLAAGIGITPLLSMARHLQAAGAPYELRYFARSREQAAFVEALAEEGLAEHTTFHFGLDADSTRAAIGEAVETPSAGLHLYACGPQPFLAAVQAATTDRWPAAQVHMEFFQPAERPPASGERAFRVQIASTGQILDVPPDRTIAEVLADHGVAVPLSCEQGICGTCLTGVLGGTPDHRDGLLDEESRAAGDLMALCVSRSKSDLLILDL